MCSKLCPLIDSPSTHSCGLLRLHCLQVMQVKNFGRRGRTKYTHLVDQDTTDFTDPSAQDVSLRHKRRLAGTDLEFSRPKALRT